MLCYHLIQHMDSKKLIDFEEAKNTVSDQKDMWDFFWSQGFIQRLIDIARQFETSFYISTFLKPYLNVGSFCELGCGTSILLSKIAKGVDKIVALDYSSQALEVSKVRFEKAGISNYELVQRDIRNTKDISERYDVVFSNGLVEHFKEPHKAIRAHLELTKENGTTLILVPHQYSIKKLWFKLTDTPQLKKYWLWTEQYFFTKRSMKKEYEQACPDCPYSYEIRSIHLTGNVLLIVNKGGKRK